MITVNRTYLLSGIGLMLAGLLAGILLMLAVDDSAQAPIRPAVIAPVNLGDSAVQLSRASDSAAPSAQLGRLNELFRGVSMEAARAVVSIRTNTGRANEAPANWYDMFDGETRRYLPPHGQVSVGSGVIISDEGYIVTNYHVIRAASGINVTLNDKREFEARLVGVDPTTDLAVLKIAADDELPALYMGNSRDVQVGEWVLAIGNPFRLSSTVTAGIVSALGRQVNIIDSYQRIEDFIQTDAAINPGNSGGALVNLRGELVGINTAIATESGSYEGYGFAIPVNLVRSVVSDLIAYGEVRRGYLGIEIGEVDARAAERLGLADIRGVRVADVVDEGPGDNAGLRRNDVILAINEHIVNAPNTLQRVVAAHQPGEWLNLRLWRGGETLVTQAQLLGREATVYDDWFSEYEQPQPAPPQRDTPEEAPPGDAEVFHLKDWGVGFSFLTEERKETFGAREGVYVAYVEKGTPAGRAGLPRDVVLLSVNDSSIASLNEALGALGEAEQEGAALLKVKRSDGTTAFYEVLAP